MAAASDRAARFLSPPSIKMPLPMRSKERSFTTASSSTGDEGGRYIAASPDAAARKAGRIILRSKPDSKRQVTVTMRETTRGSGETTDRSYVVTRSPRADPGKFGAKWEYGVRATKNRES
jgi:hypothetical protein